MKDAEDEAFDEIAKKQGHWGGGFMAKKAMAADKQREWVGLTDEERSKIWGGIIKYAPSETRIKDFAQAIEAKLKEKNT